MIIDILTLFPEMFSPLKASILGRAEEKGILEITLTDIRDFSNNKHKKADDYPFGGGGGMVMMPEPIFGALEKKIEQRGRSLQSYSQPDSPCGIIYMSPRGSVLDKEKIRELLKLEEMIILCGHYEGVDQRVLDYFHAEEISIGDYVLTGGELPAMVLIDCVARMLPDVLGNENSALEESIYSGLLEHPQYTQPREYRGIEVPEVLLNGNHKLIELWKFRESLVLTRKRRPDLFKEFVKNPGELTKEEQRILEEIK